jgi:Xaa-Pro aminopeptidase
VYDVVLAAHTAAVRVTKAGMSLLEIDAAARSVIAKAGFADAFVHGIGHHLGIETHDASPDLPLKDGAVITIEPGIYLPSEKIGIRIEDDVLVGRNAATILSERIPREPNEIERRMGDRSGRAPIFSSAPPASRTRARPKQRRNTAKRS